MFLIMLLLSNSLLGWVEIVMVSGISVPRDTVQRTSMIYLQSL